MAEPTKRHESVSNKPVQPKLEYVFTIEAEIDTPRSAGQSATGERLHIPITGGKIHGPKLSGKILPGGSDWPLIGSDGHSRIEAHYTIETDDGVLIYVVNRAMRISSDEVRTRLRAGENVSPDEYYMRGTPVFDAPDGAYSWLRETVFTCSIAPQGKSVEIDVYAVR